MADIEDGKLLHDEQGSRSAMRYLLFCVAMPVLAGMTLAEGAGRHQFQTAVWTVWSTISSMLILGCFGPRIAQYLGPQLGQIATSIATSTRDPREPSRLDKNKED